MFLGARDSRKETGEKDIVFEVVPLDVIGHCDIKSFSEMFRYGLTTCQLSGPHYCHGKTIAKFHFQGRTSQALKKTNSFGFGFFF